MNEELASLIDEVFSQEQDFATWVISKITQTELLNLKGRLTAGIIVAYNTADTSTSFAKAFPWNHEKLLDHMSELKGLYYYQSI